MARARLLLPALFVAAALALAALAGCTNPFDPATPPPPTVSGTADDFSSPEKLLETMANGMSRRDDVGRASYLNALADSIADPTMPGFYALPWSEVLTDWLQQAAGRVPPEPWDRDREYRFFEYMRTVGQPTYVYTFEWTKDTSQPEPIFTDATALMHQHYTLVSMSPDLNHTVRDTIAIGNADLQMIKFKGRWWLSRWEDRLDKSPGIGLHPANTELQSMGQRRLNSAS